MATETPDFPGRKPAPTGNWTASDLPDWLPQHSAQLLGRNPAGVTQIDLVVFAVRTISVLGNPLLVQPRQCRAFIFIGSDVQDLYGKPLMVSFQP